MKKDNGGVRGERIKNSLSFYPLSLEDEVFKTERQFPPMKQLKNFIEAHKHSKCGGSYRKGVVFDSSGAICRIFINFTTSKLDKHSEDFDTIFYAGRGKKDTNKYFVENTDKNPENLKMKNNKEAFPIYVKMKNGYFYLGRYVIEKARKKKQFNPNLRCDFETLGFLCKKI